MTDGKTWVIHYFFFMELSEGRNKRYFTAGRICLPSAFSARAPPSYDSCESESSKKMAKPNTIDDVLRTLYRYDDDGDDDDDDSEGENTFIRAATQASN